MRRKPPAPPDLASISLGPLDISSHFTRKWADTFIFGCILENGEIAVDYNKLNFLRSLSAGSLDYCKDCFAKWHCAGDCVMRIGHLQFSGDRGGERCQTNREIIAYRIVQMLERKDNNG